MVLSACAQIPDQYSPSTAQTGTIENTSVSTGEREEYEKGLIALKNNEISKAEWIFDELLKDKPELAGPYTNLALIQFKKKNYELSLELVNKALLRNPEQAQAYQLRGQIFLTKRKIHDAQKDYLKSIELKPDYIIAHYNLALLYDIYLQEIASAIKHYETYLSLSKKPDEATREWVNHLKGILADG
jgi:tetratricopeptide (TPR) repeat protein